MPGVGHEKRTRREARSDREKGNHAARRKAPGNGEGGYAGSAGKIEDALGPGRDALDDAALPQPIDAEGRRGDHEVVRAPGAAEESLDEIEPLIVA